MDGHIGRRDLIHSFSDQIAAAFSTQPGTHRLAPYNDLVESAIVEMNKANSFANAAGPPDKFSGKLVFYNAAMYHIADALQKLRAAKQ